MKANIVRTVMYTVSVPVILLLFPIVLLAFLLVLFNATGISDKLMDTFVKISNIIGGRLDKFEGRLRLSWDVTAK